MAKVRPAWSLGRGRHVAIPVPEFFRWATRAGLQRAETLTLVGMIAAWDIREEPVVEVSLVDLQEFSAASKGYQSELVKTLATGFRPSILRVLPPARARAPRRFDLRPLIRAVNSSSLPSRVRPSEPGRVRGSEPRGSAGRTERFSGANPTVRPSEPSGSAERTLASDPNGRDARAKNPKSEDERGSEVSSMGPEELRDALLGTGPRAEAARAEWARRQSRNRR